MDLGKAKDLLYTTDCDVNIRFVDDIDEITIEAHQIVLSLACDFFKKMFSFGDRPNQYSIIVPDINCGVNIIKEFYGLNDRVSGDWLYILNYMKCRDYFGLKLDVSMLYSINVPEEGIGLYIDVIEILFPKRKSALKDKMLVHSMKNNLCYRINYNKNQIYYYDLLPRPDPPKFFIKLIKNDLGISFVSSSGLEFHLNKMNINSSNANPLCGNQYLFQKKSYFVNISSTVKQFVDSIEKYSWTMIISPNNENIVIKLLDGDSSSIRCFKTVTRTQLWEKSLPLGTVLAYTPNCQKLIYFQEFGADSHIGIIDATNGNLLKKISIFGFFSISYWNQPATINSEYTVKNIIVSPNSAMVAFVRSHWISNQSTCQIWNINSYQIVQEIEIDHEFICTAFSLDNKLIVIVCGKTQPYQEIIFVDIDSGRTVYRIENFSNRIVNATFSSNGAELFVISKSKFHIIDIKTKIIVCEFQDDLQRFYELKH